MKFVEVHRLVGEGKDIQEGIIFLDDKGDLKCHPEDNLFLQHLMSETVKRYPHGTKPEGVKSNEPEVFLESLHHQYQSPYLRVGPVK